MRGMASQITDMFCQLDSPFRVRWPEEYLHHSTRPRVVNVILPQSRMHCLRMSISLFPSFDAFTHHFHKLIVIQKQISIAPNSVCLNNASLATQPYFMKAAVFLWKPKSNLSESRGCTIGITMGCSQTFALVSTALSFVDKEKLLCL